MNLTELLDSFKSSTAYWLEYNGEIKLVRIKLFDFTTLKYITIDVFPKDMHSEDVEFLKTLTLEHIPLTGVIQPDNTIVYMTQDEADGKVFYDWTDDSEYVHELIEKLKFIRERM